MGEDMLVLVNVESAVCVAVATFLPEGRLTLFYVFR